MASTPDRTDVAPQRRMAVARATLTGAAGAAPDEAEDARASQAAFAAVRSIATWLADADPAQPTHIDILWSAVDDDLHCTCTVQAFARDSLGAHARLGAVVACLALDTGASINDVYVVQEIAD